MFKYTLAALVFFLLPCTSIHAQDWMNDVKDPSNFFSIQKAFYEEEANGRDSAEEDGINEIHQRWANFVRPRINADGKPFAPDAVYLAYNQYKAAHRNTAMYKQPIWQYAGPAGVPDNGGGTGRINCIAVQPGNTGVIWAGTPTGGLWKSTDRGINWTTNSDTFPNLGVSDIAIDRTNPSTMYIATGDGFGYVFNNGPFIGLNYSNGVMKSIDGGQTFTSTGLNWTQTQTNQIFKLQISPKNRNMVLAAASNGLWKSADGGKSWSNRLNGQISDVKINPYNPSIMYATGGAMFYYSVDSGNSWTSSSDTISTRNFSTVVLAVAPNTKSTVYALGITLQNNFNASYGTYISYGYLYKSVDNGKNWRTIGLITNDVFYGKYTSGMAVSPTDSNHIVVAGFALTESRDGGNTWGLISNSIHPDHRAPLFVTNDTLYDGNDGGLYRVELRNRNFNFISDGIHALQFYGVSTSAAKPDRYFAGAQDNGINRANNNYWDHVGPKADGMLCAVSNYLPNIVYINNQYGAIYKSTNGGSSFDYYIRPDNIASANWVVPVAISHSAADKLYFGADDLYWAINPTGTSVKYKPTSNGTWTKMNAGSGDNVSHFAVAQSSENYIYVIRQSDYQNSYASVYMTSDAGKTWKKITKTLPASYYLSDIKVDKFDSLKVWVTVSGFNPGNKVYYSADGGDNWTNFSGTLPNVPVNCITLENSSEHGVYIGTDMGVFYRNDYDTDWRHYSDNLPNTIVSNIEIIASQNKLRASTFGRGIWQGQIAGTLLSVEKVEDLENKILIFPNPSTGFLNITLPQFNGSARGIEVYDMLGRKILNVHGHDLGSGTVQLDLTNRPVGIYSLIFNFGNDIVVKKVLITK